jgi:DNA polymerase V
MYSSPPGAGFFLPSRSGAIMPMTVLARIDVSQIRLPLYSHRVPAGFPSPAADHLEKHISLDELFDIRAPHVYLVKIEGESMMGAGIYDGDLVIVDRGREPQHGDIVIAALNGEPVCKRLHHRGREVILQSENKAYSPRFILESDEMLVWGVVRYSVRDHAYP